MQDEALFAQLKELAASEPDFRQAPPDQVAKWLGRAHNALERANMGIDVISFRVAADGLDGLLLDRNVKSIRNILYRAIAKIEQQLPEAAQGGFIAAGDVFDALTVMGAALEKAQGRVLFVDPYMGPEVLAKYALMASEGVQVDLLAGKGKVKPALTPAAKEWVRQYGDKRPLRFRLVDAGLLHDRLLFVDEKDVWDISQSLNALAARSPATISKSNAEHAAMKIGAYAPLFDNADPVI